MTHFQPMLDLEIEPTIAMRRGEQAVFQCSWCGCVVVQPASPSARLGNLGDCPSCHQSVDWLRQALPLAGLRVREAAA